MPGKPRILVDDGVYHIISRGNNKLSVLGLEGGFEHFKAVLMESKKKYPWDIYHYCLMPNHIHILGRPGDSRILPKLMHFLLLGYSRWYREQTGYVGHVWQGRYKNPLIDRESYMLECGRYIERNPVRAGLVRSPEDYPWSSYRHYCLGYHDELVTSDPYYESFGFTSEERRIQYRSFIKLPTTSPF